MARDDNLIKKTYRLPKSQTDFMEALADAGLFGKEADVVRTLLDRAIKELIETEYVRKHLETMELLKNGELGSDQG